MGSRSNRRYRTDDGWKTDTEWIRVVAWRYETEKAGELRKGDRVLVQGRLQRDEWTDDEGRDRETVKVVTRRLIGLADRDQEEQERDEESIDGRPAKEPEDVRKPSREEKRIAGATEGEGEFSGFTDESLMGDDGLPF